MTESFDKNKDLPIKMMELETARKYLECRARTDYLLKQIMGIGRVLQNMVDAEVAHPDDFGILGEIAGEKASDILDTLEKFVSSDKLYDDLREIDKDEELKKSSTRVRIKC